MLREPLESGGILDPMDPLGRIYTRPIDPEVGFPYRGMQGIFSTPLPSAYEINPAAPEGDRLAMAVSLGIDPAEVPLCRYVPFDLYIDVSPDEIPNDYLMMLMVRLTEFCSMFGCDIVRQTDLEIGSSRWRPTLRTKRRYTARQAEERKQAMAIVLAAALQEKAKESGTTQLHCDHELQKLIAETELAKAETERAKAETEKARAETKQSSAETFKARAEGAKALAEILLKAVAGVSLLLGTLHFIAKPAPSEATGEPAKVVSMRLVDPATAFQIWAGDEHRDIVFVQDPSGLKIVSVAPPEAGDDDEGP